LITSESHEIRKNRCDYRTKSKNIYAGLNLCVNVSGSQASTGKGFQSTKNYRLLKESVDATRSQAFSGREFQATKIYAEVKPRVNAVEACREKNPIERLSPSQGLKSLINGTERLRVSFTRSLKRSDLNPAQACLCNSCKNLPEGLSPSELQFPVVFERENSVYSVQKLISLFVFSVIVAGIAYILPPNWQCTESESSKISLGVVNLI
jgi:hypothetical protein